MAKKANGAVKEEPKGTHKTLHCVNCHKDFDADHEDVTSVPCLSKEGSHNLVGNNDAE